MLLKDYLKPIFKLLQYIVCVTGLVALFDLNQNTLRLTFFRVSQYADIEPFDERMRIFDLVAACCIVTVIYVILSVHHVWRTHQLEHQKLNGSENDDIMRKVLVDEIDRILQSSENINFNEVKMRRRSYSAKRNKHNFMANQGDSSDLETTN